ncbi:MAG TPA: histidine kinase [Bryobacteraceae bacterium]
MVRAREWLPLWMWSIVIWTVLAIVNGTQVVVGMRAQGMQHPWSRLFAAQALSWALWALLSPAVLLLGRRFPAEHYWAMHLGVYAAIGLMHAGWIVALQVMLEPLGPAYKSYTVVDAFASFFYSRFHLDFFAYAAILALGRMLDSRRTLAEREEQLAQAKLDALRRQLEPHFLFNTLNGIAGLVRTGENATAVEMIAGLSALLRRVVDGPMGLETSLAEEIEFVEKYLVLQQMRFASRLRVKVEIPDELASARVPSMILQPIVENAIKHGIAVRLDGGWIRLSARRADDLLTIRVENEGPQLKPSAEGVGIANTRARLKSMYGNGARFAIHNMAGGLVEAVVTVPYQTS